MNKISCALIGASLALSSQLVQADSTYQYEIIMPGHYYQPLYPNLNLNELNKISVQAVKKDFNPEMELEQMTLDFQHATDLVVKNFSRDGNVYRAIVDDAWVYKQVLVEVHAMEPISNHSNMEIRLFVVEQNSNLDQPSQSFGMETFQAHGNLMDITPNPLADETSLTVGGKNLQLKLYRNPTDVITPMYGNYGFKIEADWMGHGNRVFAIPAPFGPMDADQFDAVSLQIESFPISPTEMDYQIAVHYVDKFGYPNSTPLMPLQDYLMQVFPGATYP
ncbi:MAG: hypothetical protein VYA55_02945 [Pseudomonadota bacterium]|nr:hypothetical protein [Pseudomonadota bacterium]